MSRILRSVLVYGENFPPNQLYRQMLRQPRSRQHLLLADKRTLREFATNMDEKYRLSNAMRSRLDAQLDRYESLMVALSSESTDSGDHRSKVQEIASLQRVAGLVQQLRDLEREQQSLESMKNEPDNELRAMIDEEIVTNADARRSIEHQLLVSLIPADPAESGSS